jgi:hypothetical protein
VSPLDDGLVFGEMQRNDFSGRVNVAEAGPRLIEFRNGLGLEQKLFDSHSNGRERLMVIMRTFIGNDQLKDEQRKIKAQLDGYISQHRAFVEAYMLRARLAFDSGKHGKEHAKLYASRLLGKSESARLAEYKSAMDELEELISSRDWLTVIDRSVQNLTKRAE